jgi:hypothetical protein
MERDGERRVQIEIEVGKQILIDEELRRYEEQVRRTSSVVGRIPTRVRGGRRCD